MTLTNGLKTGLRAGDSLSDLGEEAQLKLQMSMDRRSQALSTLSNVLKKTSDTSSGIIGNLK